MKYKGRSGAGAVFTGEARNGKNPKRQRTGALQKHGLKIRYLRAGGSRLNRRPAMAFLNDNYLKLKAGYLFPEIGRRVKAFTDANADAAKRLIRCGIGDVTEPLPAACREAMHRAIDDLGPRENFKGYGPEQGYEWLRHAIAENDYRQHGIEVADDEIIVSDGS